MHRGSSQRAPPPVQSQVSQCSPLHPGLQIHRCSSPATRTHTPFSLQSWSHLANDVTKTHLLFCRCWSNTKERIITYEYYKELLSMVHGNCKCMGHLCHLKLCNFREDILAIQYRCHSQSHPLPSYMYHNLHLDPSNVMCDKFYAFDIYHPISQPHLFGLLHTPLTHSGLSQMGWAQGKSSSW